MTPAHRRLAGRRLLALVMAALFAAAAPVMAQDDSPCGPVAEPGHYGPFDYVTQHGSLLIVERFHFSPKVEALVGGESGYLGNDLAYTLKASPNHHRALLSLMRYGARTKSTQPPNIDRSIECYFDRAIRFKPEDTVVRSLYAMYLGQQLNRMADAERQLQAAVHFAADSGLSHHSIGLVYLEFKMYDQALAEAHAALKYGYPGTELSDALKLAGRWKAPVP
jgi:hypothetical protein